jgi:hypothetical protein
VWEKDHRKYLAWLRKGAPPYTLSFAGSAVVDLLDLSSTMPEQEDEFMQEMRLTRGDGDRWMKEPELVIYELREWYEEALRTLTRELGDRGPHYLSLGSWPTGVGFVAGGDDTPSQGPSPFTNESGMDRYLARSNHMVLFRNRSDREIIDIDGEPDITSALEKNTGKWMRAQ